MAREVDTNYASMGSEQTKEEISRRKVVSCVDFHQFLVYHCLIKTQSEGVLTDQSKSCPTNSNTPGVSSSLGRKVSTFQNMTWNSVAKCACGAASVGKDGGWHVCFVPTTFHKYLLRANSIFKFS